MTNYNRRRAINFTSEMKSVQLFEHFIYYNNQNQLSMKQTTIILQVNTRQRASKRKN